MPDNKPDEALVEAVARAIAAADDEDFEGWGSLYRNRARAAIPIAYEAGRRAMQEEAAKVADAEYAGRMRQKAAAQDAKLRKEARDYETMAIAATHIATAIRSLTVSQEGEG